MKLHRLEKMFNPRTIAVVGANRDASTAGGCIYDNLTRGGFTGKVFPVNPKHRKIDEAQCYASLADIEAKVDLAVIAVPARAVIGVIADCGKCGIGNAIVLSSGFSEASKDGRQLETMLKDAALRHGVQIIGPNCLGVQRPVSQINATFLQTAAPEGRLALISQSGALCAAIVDWSKPHDLGFSSIVALGNAADVGFGDVLDYLASDPKSDAILLYVESVNDARGFMSGLRLAARAKPVIVLKSGRRSTGRKAASTHTGVLVGSDDVFDAALERAGVVRARTFSQLFAAAEILSSSKRVGGDRLAIITNGGGAGVLATDRAEELGVSVSALTQDTMAILDKALPPNWSRANPVDLLGDAGPERFKLAVGACLADENTDGVLVLFTPYAVSDPNAVASAIVDIAQKQSSPKPVLACFMGEERVLEARRTLSRNRISDFTSPERAVEAFSYLVRYKRNQELLLQTPGPISHDEKEPDAEGARMIIDSVLAQGRSILSDIESKAILSAFGIACTQTIEVETAAEALVAAETLGFPVTMKISSPQILHKSDFGGVKVGLANAVQVRSAFETIKANVLARKPDAEIRGVTIEPMVSGSGSRELIVGSKRDPVFGPALSFGAGGTMAEILRDNAVALPPLNRILAKRLINRTSVARLLDPFRDLPEANKTRVEDVLLSVSDLVCELPHVDELDINPLFADQHDVIAADARITLRRPQSGPRPYSHMAIHPYPKHLVKTRYLADGTLLTVRPIRPEDAQREQEFVRGLSPTAKHYRFMLSLKELTPQMLSRFTQIDYSREMALVASVEIDGAERQIGVARYVINPDGESCEFAIVISDDWQNRGLGSMLMKDLMEAARGHGLRMIEGEVLADNQPMLSLMESLGFSVRTSPEDLHLKLVQHRI
ncbi:MAG: bifunctional acetate--CoA ligase family protein/GNAT family N-acetyltransferase [Pseudomonadota bacterium]